MMENRPKLLINRNILLSEKSPPPTKLLLNHGKPNFTIVKSPKTTSPPPIEVNIFSGTDLKPSTLKKKSPPKLTPINGSTSESTESNEFLRLHKKIGGKNYDEIDGSNSIDSAINSCDESENVTVVKEVSPKNQQFATLQKNYILSLKTSSETTNGVSDKAGSPNQVNGNTSKSPTPEKSPSPNKMESLKHTQNGELSRSPSPMTKQNNSSLNQSSESVTSPVGVHFEQRTVVSFSRDLSVTPNRYPDTVKTTKSIDGGMNALPKEFAELKFEIASNGALIRPVRKNAT